ncbi:inactive rhomboid protein 1-like [Anopheles bellator]|uniref:inactive rhomboid protein 1-like n=1 Tax=Anopheles bellator TaxID=139047 RepID=UPI002647E6AA|nr:inactive rhomboid protein 1-like [Anopheles bellator]
MEDGAAYGHPAAAAAATPHHMQPHHHHQLPKDLSHHYQPHHRTSAAPQASHHAKPGHHQPQQQPPPTTAPAPGPPLQSSPSWYPGTTGGTLRSAAGSGRRASYSHSHYQPASALSLPPPSATHYQQVDVADNLSIGSGHSVSAVRPHHQHRSPAVGSEGRVGGNSSAAAAAGVLIDRSGSTDRFGALEDPLSTSCLQPPSPAPSNDHYSVMGLPAPGPQSGPTHHGHYSDRHYGTIQRRTASPSNIRYRHSLTDSYRDMSPQCDRYIPPPAHFLAAADTYGYLGANVHTPIKRYVPTPPPQEPTYHPSGAGVSSSAKTQALMSALLGHGGAGAPGAMRAAPHHPAQYAYATSTLPYGFRVKGNSANNEPTTTISPPKGFESPDPYASNGSTAPPPARVRPPKCPSSLVAAAHTSTLPHAASHGARSSSTSRHPQVGMAPAAAPTGPRHMSRTSSAEFLDQPRTMYRVSTPVSVMSEPGGAGRDASASCLHCNTLRRTTGVHQTTQTTGPISPQPVAAPELPASGGGSVPISPASLTSPQQQHTGQLSIQQQQHQLSSPYIASQHPVHQLQHSQSHTLPPSVATAHSSSHSQTYDNLHDGAQLADGSAVDRDSATMPRNPVGKHQPFVGAGRSTDTPSSMESILSASSSSRTMLIQQQQQPQYSNLTQHQPSSPAPPAPAPPPQQQPLPPQQPIAAPTAQQSVPPQQAPVTSPQQHPATEPQQAAAVPQQPASPPPPAISAVPSPAPYVAPHPLPPMVPHPASLNDSPASTLQRSSNAQLLRIPAQSNLSCKQRLKEYARREAAKFFGILPAAADEEYERNKWHDRQRRFACRRFGALRDDADDPNGGGGGGVGAGGAAHHPQRDHGGANHGAGSLAPSDRPDILPAQSQDERETELSRRQRASPHFASGGHDPAGGEVYLVRAERKPSVPAVLYGGLSFVVQSITRRRLRTHKQWSRSFAPAHVELSGADGPSEHCDGLAPIADGEAFFDTPTAAGPGMVGSAMGGGAGGLMAPAHDNNSRQLFVSEGDRTTGSGIINGWRTKSSELHHHHHQQQHQQQQAGAQAAGQGQQQNLEPAASMVYGQRISANILDGVLDNSLRPVRNRVKLLRPNLLDERYDYRPFFTYWVNTVQIVVMVLSLICYGFGPIGIGMEYRSAQVLVTSLSLQQVHHQEPRNIWIGLRSADLIHLGAKYGACMRRDAKIMDVVSRTRKHERETACCIRNDDSGCVQSSQADCSIRGWPSKTIATWKKWSPGESGPGGRISGSVCGLDPKYCDAPASIAPHEWPDDITKWPICRKNNQLSQRFRFKDHTAEHMVCEVIGHPCCIGVYGECRITTREYCDFVNGYFHEEASLCSQVSCLNDVCGMFHFMAADYPDQFYRLFTSLCLHAGLIHLLVSVAFQHVLLADLERLVGPLRTAILYIGSGIAGNLTSAIFVPYKAEVGPLPSIAGVLASLMLQLVLCHWKSLKKPHIAMIKLLILGCALFGLGTLPLQQNFTGLIAGLLTGIGLTLAIVPFVNVTKHSRKSKINLIWTCVTLQFLLYAVMFIIFYAFPALFESLNFIDGNQLMDPNAGHGYHDHYSLYDGYNNYNPLGPGSGHTGGGHGAGHGHGAGGGGPGGSPTGGPGNNGKIGTYNNNNIYKTSGGNVMHNHHDYTAGGGNVISMSGGATRNSGPGGRTAVGNNLLKTISLCEKGQCVLRQPRHADTNA